MASAFYQQRGSDRPCGEKCTQNTVTVVNTQSSWFWVSPAWALFSAALASVLASLASFKFFPVFACGLGVDWPEGASSCRVRRRVPHTHFSIISACPNSFFTRSWRNFMHSGKLFHLATSAFCGLKIPACSIGCGVWVFPSGSCLDETPWLTRFPRLLPKLL